MGSKKLKGSKFNKPELKTAAPTRSEQRRLERKRAKLKGKESARKRSDASQPLLPGTWHTNVVIFLLLMIASVALYAGDLRLGFFRVDDPQYVVDNPWIRGVTLQNLSHILGSPYFANYSPLHLLSYMIDYAVAGPNPFAFHLSSNIWAGIVAGCVFLVVLILTGRRVVAVPAAVLFIVHPAHVEAIAWISSRKDLVAAAFALPSLLAYLRYRQNRATARRWYVVSLLLFLMAVAGKLSVATLPAIFLAHDLFVERRLLSRSLWDKIPFLVGAGGIAMVAASAQPSMGHRPSPYVFSAVLGQSLALLTGFGRYVIYRVPPNQAAGTALQLAGVVVLLAVFAAPLLLRRRWPMAVVLVYWILFSLVPAQVLSFTHPVTDRYLFFASVGMVALIAWGLITAGERLAQRRGLVGAVVLLGIITLLWGRTTLAYVAEWRDPRSVWYAATEKSADPIVYQNLGSHYQGMAGRLGNSPRPTPLPEEEARQLASVVWAGDERLPALLSEWTGGQRGGPTEKAFQDHLRALAWDAFEHALLNKGVHVMPGLYYNRGLILLERGDLSGARKEFLAAIDEASRETFAPVRQEITVYCHTNLGVIAMKEGDYREALRWFRMADDEQKRFGGNWLPDLSANRKKLEAMVDSPANR